MASAQVTALIVTYNSAGVISDLLGDIYQIDPDFSVVVVDNASTDKTVEGIQAQHPRVHLIKNSHNLGYAKAVNLGFDFCSTAYVFLLNPDIRLPNHEVVSGLINWLDANPLAGAAAPIQFMLDGHKPHLNFTCSYWSRKAFAGYFYYQIHQRWESTQAIRVPLLNAGCIMIRRSAFLHVGKFNPKYFLYGEDPDLGMKFSRYGYERWLLPALSVIHFREKSFQTLSTSQRVGVKWRAIWNICDAFLSGWARILWDKVTMNKLHPM